MTARTATIPAVASDRNTALIYAVSVPTVRRWRASGRKAKIPVPLSEPGKMPDWWATMAAAGHFSKPCPMSIIEAAESFTGTPSGSTTGPVLPISDPGLLATLAALDADGAEFDYSDGLVIAKRNLQVCDYLLQRALKADDVKQVGQLQRRLNEASDFYRALMRDRGKIEADAELTLPKEEIRAELLEIHGNITRRFRQTFKQIHPEIGEKAETRESWNVLVDTTVDMICAKLTGTRFAACSKGSSRTSGDDLAPSCET